MRNGPPWGRIMAEGLVVIVSILAAFAIDAWWDERGERADETRLLADLAQEFRENRTELQETNSRHLERAEQLRALIREATPDAVGLGSDSLAALAAAALLNPRYNPEMGVMERAQSGNGLAVVSDPELRASLAGFWNRFDSYFSNQDKITSEVVFSAAVAFGTGTLVWQSFPKLEALGSTTMWSDPLAADQVAALKYFAIAEFISSLLARQGEALLDELDGVLTGLEQALVDR